jgi:hypothetical protein
MPIHNEVILSADANLYEAHFMLWLQAFGLSPRVSNVHSSTAYNAVTDCKNILGHNNPIR